MSTSFSAGETDRTDYTVYDRFRDIAGRYGAAPFLAVTKNQGRPFAGGRSAATYSEIALVVEDAATIFRAAGYGEGHRVGLLLGNHPDHFVYLLTLNSLGASVVPLNPDATSAELAYVIGHAEVDLLLVSDHQHDRIDAIAAASPKRPQVRTNLQYGVRMPAEAARARSETRRLREACVYYTSGTTGLPKGCILTNEYFDFIGRFYVEAGGVAQLRLGQDRILNPLPLFHQNAGVFTFMGALLSANCFIMTDRFHATTWWEEVERCGATVFHYLGVMSCCRFG